MYAAVSIYPFIYQCDVRGMCIDYLQLSRLCRGIECPVKTVRDVDRHHSPAQLLERFGI